MRISSRGDFGKHIAEPILKWLRKIPRRKRSAYLKDGRLADVLAAIQLMAARERPQAEIKKWAEELSGSEVGEREVDRWTAVFEEHPEFFVMYKLKGDVKAALRLRYTNKFYDPRINKTYTPEETDELSTERRWALTTKPLKTDSISTMMNAAIELHHRAVEELMARRWWVPVLPPFSVFSGHFWARQSRGFLGITRRRGMRTSLRRKKP